MSRFDSSDSSVTTRADRGAHFILFDIDGTLLRTQGAGMAAMSTALAELLPGTAISFEGIEVAGRLDTLIWRDLAAKHGFAAEDDLHARFRATYAKHLERRLAEKPGETRVMPGVHALLEALRRSREAELGLLTGNYAETGTLKIRSGGIDADLFTINAWGDDGGSRRDLPPVALRRHLERTGRNADPSRTVIIGDTPHDVDCALASGCLVIGVATGDFDAAILAEHGAHLALDTLEDTDAILAWLRRGGA